MISRKPGDIIHGSYGYKFRITEEHLTDEELDSLKSSHDELGSAAVEKLQAIHERKKAKTDGGASSDRPDLLALLQEHHSEDKTLQAFWDEVYTIPDWVDLQQLERGQRVFNRYAPGNFMGLLILGFIRDNSGNPGVAEVLAKTGGLTPKHLLPRMIETGTWLIRVAHSLEFIKPGGEGHTTTVRVRLLHATMRQRILKLADAYPGYFDWKKHGVPANNLDSVQAISQFGCLPMWDALPQLGVYPSKQEIIDFVALHRYIAYIIGAPHHYFETVTKAKAVMESMYLRPAVMSTTSKTVARNFIAWIVDKPPIYLSTEFLEASSRLMNGNSASDELGLGSPSLYYYCAFFGFKMIVSAMAAAQQVFPPFDRYIVKFWHEATYSAIKDNEHRMGKKPFSFKYIPQATLRFDTKIEPVKDENIRDIDGRRILQRVLFAAFVFGILSSLLLAYCFWKLLGYASRKLG